ncbi:hypothetical protein HOO65_080274 [Ceratocystis lukuohia]|uniref:Uncharacterized protein n=1 Tax=Ceratocystis lukuohia TaxID=2019550 RepID=A0ABR4MAM8_9PEZI
MQEHNMKSPTRALDVLTGPVSVGPGVAAAAAAAAAAATAAPDTRDLVRRLEQPAAPTQASFRILNGSVDIWSCFSAFLANRCNVGIKPPGWGLEPCSKHRKTLGDTWRSPELRPS